MTSRIYRIAIVGASSLLGKELSGELNESLLAASNISLLEEEEETAGQLTAAGDEAAFIQKIDSTSFEQMDFVFFVGTPDETRRHWQEARKAGASILDLTYVLEGEKDVVVMSPWVSEVEGRQAPAAPGVDLGTQAVVPAHPVAMMLALVAARVQAKLPVRVLTATVMEPASEHGRDAMDEMHQQTVSLLSFQTLPREQYDAQVSFNLLPSLGGVAKVHLDAIESRIRRQYKALSHGVLPELSMQMVQAPVFHGYVASVFVETEKAATVAQVEEALTGEHIDVVTRESEPPSNLSAAGQEEIMVRVTGESEGAEQGTRFWLWLAADNLKLAADHAIACAAELRRLRPSGKVQ
ncbi:Asd/ArgC dimerization domain-containing protein [Edaphobacter albus]|uniref:Asd/ArgC dimerization domain-containing protein n=1 Tax=Edaphobacter sp. 4G125 TaxID=2763071 RepID=UPI001647A457|nr:Asd/ArgC dimerization domain-containing protein [Edaphobacter sp. 4G125]QNI35887.1 segregation protein B [Edaphobacter sp. 4G125]